MKVIAIEKKHKKDKITKGNIVIGIHGTIVLITDEKSKEGPMYFGGIVLKAGGDHCEEGKYNDDWVKINFNQFHGTITLEY